MLKVLLIGPPACGKGTQSEKLKTRYNLVHVSTGECLRESVKNQTGLGMKVKNYMDSGQLVPSELVQNLVGLKLKEKDVKRRGWILDGIPRTGEQAHFLVRQKIIPDIVVQIDVSEEEVVRRITGRRVDPVTGKIYHLEFNPPPKDIIGRLKKRSDDNVEVVKKRYMVYMDTVDAILKLFKVHKIDGMRSSEDVANDIFKALDIICERKL